MATLTLYDYLSLLGLALVIITGSRWMILIKRRQQKKKDGFRAFLVGRIMADKVLSGIRPFRSKSEAAQFVFTMVEKYKYAYAARNGYVAIDNVQALCRNVVDDLRNDYGIKLYFSSR